MREIQSLAGSQILLQCRPNAHHCSVAEQAHYDGTLLGSLLNAEKSLSWNPSVTDGLLESLTLTLTNDYIEAIIAQVASLTGTLYTITDNGDGLVLQHLTCLLQGKLFAGHYLFDDTAKIHFCHSYMIK